MHLHPDYRPRADARWAVHWLAAGGTALVALAVLFGWVYPAVLHVAFERPRDFLIGLAAAGVVAASTAAFVLNRDYTRWLEQRLALHEGQDLLVSDDHNGDHEAQRPADAGPD
jgi:hypothetical protein